MTNLSLWGRLLIGFLVTGLLSSCGPGSPPVVVTATFPPPESVPPVQTDLQPTAEAALSEVISPSPNPTRVLDASLTDGTASLTYTVRAGDTLSTIAAATGVSLESLISLNELANPDVLSVGQVLELPPAPSEFTPAIKQLSDSRLVRGPSALPFDTASFVATQPGFIRTATDEVERSLPNGFRVTETLTAIEVVERVSREFSVDPRVLLALLEYKAGWLSNTTLTEAQLRFPLGEIDENREGLYRQLTWAADRLNEGYYGWRYDSFEILQFPSGERLLYEPSLNAASVAIQFFLSQNQTYAQWQTEMQSSLFLGLYTRYFGDPFAESVELIPDDIAQPEFVLPFQQGETWFYTGGPHGGWGNGSAWSAIDLAPPDDRSAGDPACYTSDYAVRAVADGVISRAGDGAVVLDLNRDGYEETGWTVLYLHINSTTSVSTGESVIAGDVIGYPSCEGGFSNATHLHIARRYNGEWLPTNCLDCPVGVSVPAFTMGGWSVFGIPGQLYQGTMVRDGVTMRAEQGRLVTYNRISW